MTAPARPLKVLNTLSGQKEDLVPIKPMEVGVYVCGPTVYGHVHIGNARTFTSFDVIVRYLRHRGFKVTYVRNYTDVDDKIIQAAKQTGEQPFALADRFIAEFDKESAALGLVPPDFAPRVSQHLPEIISMIEKLVAGGYAYPSQGDVYFSVSKDPQYAKLSKRNLDELRAGERVQPGEQKREPLDFALWKAAKPGEPFWESPWGKGRPGWHIECSAMAAKYLGQSFDVHGGGRDLIFPHHENEIAQSEAAFHKPFARYWLHGGFLDLEGAKMSKSLGNVVLLRDALARVDPEALRLFFLSTHYRNQLEFSDKSLADSEARMQYFYETLAQVDERIANRDFGEGPLSEDTDRYLREFELLMDDDFNSAGATAVIASLFTSINTLLERPPAKDKAQVGRTLVRLREQVRKISAIVGLFGDDPTAWLTRRRDRVVKAKGIDTARVEKLIAERARWRLEKNFREADRIRDELKALGVEVMDKSDKTLWKVTS
jgi:cysteinyl-tRNA synthetase